MRGAHAQRDRAVVRHEAVEPVEIPALRQRIVRCRPVSEAARVPGRKVPFGLTLGDPFRDGLARSRGMGDADPNPAGVVEIRQSRGGSADRQGVGRIGENAAAGSDFVVGDVHREFPTLETLLAHVAFAPERDRLFALGDLVDRGPRSTDALAWMESGRIALSVRGNHEQMLLARIEAAEGDLGERKPLMMHPWFTRDVEQAGWTRWTAMICAMPIAATIRTPAGSVGLVHATPTARHWNTMLAKLGAGDTDTMWTAINSTAQARNDARC